MDLNEAVTNLTELINKLQAETTQKMDSFSTAITELQGQMKTEKKEKETSTVEELLKELEEEELQTSKRSSSKTKATDLDEMTRQEFATLIFNEAVNQIHAPLVKELRKMQTQLEFVRGENKLENFDELKTKVLDYRKYNPNVTIEQAYRIVKSLESEKAGEEKDEKKDDKSGSEEVKDLPNSTKGDGNKSDDEQDESAKDKFSGLRPSIGIPSLTDTDVKGAEEAVNAAFDEVFGGDE
jgi:hypothetical protein